MAAAANFIRGTFLNGTASPQTAPKAIVSFDAPHRSIVCDDPTAALGRGFIKNRFSDRLVALSGGWDEIMRNIASFTEIAIAADRKLAAHRKDLDSPFVHSYPRSCCELVAVHLGSVLENANPHKEVQIVRAYNRNSIDWHYWVEMDNLVLDLTAHQFEQYRGPLVCAKPSPLENHFPDIERISTNDALCVAQFEMNPQIECILAVFKK